MNNIGEKANKKAFLKMFMRRFDLDMTIKFRFCKPVRILCWPFKNISYKVDKFRFYKQKDAELLKSLKNIHKGERCVIIGNGPSLTIDDLNKINCSSFGSNKIIRIFDKTNWRPDYYMAVDDGILYSLKEEIPHIDSMYVFLRCNARSYIEKSDNTRYIFVYAPFIIDIFSDGQISFSEDISRQFGHCSTVTGCQIQLALYMGFKEIVLIGVDHSYNIYYNEKGEIVENGTVNYFYDDKDNKYWHIPVMHQLTTAYTLCREYADNQGVKIYNATRTSKLDVFERADFDEIMSTPVGEYGCKRRENKTGV